MTTYNVGVLGATGAVGQKFIRLLEGHPWFNVKVVAASERSAGKMYKDAVHWIENTPIPKNIANLTVSTCDASEFAGIDFVFSGLDAAVAAEIERDIANAGIPVITNARNYRRDETVPLLVPEVNPDHIKMIKNQSFGANGKGFIVTNPNCVCVPLTLSLKPLFDAFGVESIIVTSMQAVSGAGYPGVPSLDIMGNVVPYIGGEEEKIMWEPQKVLGKLNTNGTVDLAGIPVHASAYRVPVLEGHFLSVVVKLGTENVSLEDAISAFKNWESPIAKYNLPSSPEFPVKLMEEDRFPQPRLHAYDGNGMQVSVGRLRKAGIFDFAYTALGHNTIRGAAGGAILNAELLVKEGYL
jgi:aspartate-semialdehyde dehydrogenase